MARVQHPCAKCGKPCWGVNCQPCGWAKPKPRRDCVACGEPFVMESPHKSPKYCSLKCAATAKRTTPDRTCEICGSAFARRAGGRKPPRFCSRPCADDARRNGSVISGQRPRKKPPRPRAWKVYFPTCQVCGRVFSAKSKSSKYCSDQCRIDRNIERSNGRVTSLYALATQFDKRSGVYVGAEWRQRLIGYIVDRDGDKCAICNRKVNLTLKSGPKGSRKGPSIDHIIPRSKGGSDDLVNLRLTHWGCNQTRGNRGGGEQLALVG